MADREARRPWVGWSIAVAVAARVAIFAGTAAWPIANENGTPVSPLLTPGYLDYQFYLDSLQRYLRSFGDVLVEFWHFYHPIIATQGFELIAGPVFPLLLGGSGYASGHLVPLSIAYLAISVLLSAGWIVWLARRGVGGLWLVLFALLPTAVWFTVIISPDLLFAAEFAVFYFAYERRERPGDAAVWVIALVLMLLTRPNALSILLFVAADTLTVGFRARALISARTVGVALLVAASTLYLYPYFLFETNRAVDSLTYFGATPDEYLGGLFESLPGWLDVTVSAAALLAAKLVYFVGLRPSYGNTALVLVLARAAPGVILLPGLVYLFALGTNRERILVFLFCLPIILGPSQDRYYLPIYPLFFLYGVRWYAAVWHALSGPRTLGLPPDGTQGSA